MKTPATHNVAWIGEYEALTQRSALVDLGPRTRIELAGADRAAFLHNLCSNEIRKLAVGSGCEAFLTNVQGKTLAHGFVFCEPESLVFETVGGQGDRILAHLDHYLVCEQVTLVDRSAASSEWLLAGPRSESVLHTAGVECLPQGLLSGGATLLAGKSVSLRRVDWTGPLGFLVTAGREDAATVRQALGGAGAAACGQAAFEAARIERGLPWFDADITEKNLPQEIARDDAAISFVKGCYLGQETVARIDALGHVNRVLVGIRFAGPTVPPPGTELVAAGQAVGQVTSASYSPRLSAPLALGFVRSGSKAPGTRLDSSLGDAEVVALPVA